MHEIHYSFIPPVASRCIICSAGFFVEFEYQRRGVCGACVKSLAHDWLIAHAHPPMVPFSSEQQVADAKNPPPKKKPIPSGIRRRVFERDGYRCKRCGSHHELHADHIIAESKGGEATLENLQTLCGPCNRAKGAK